MSESAPEQSCIEYNHLERHTVESVDMMVVPAETNSQAPNVTLKPETLDMPEDVKVVRGFIEAADLEPEEATLLLQAFRNTPIKIAEHIHATRAILKIRILYEKVLATPAALQLTPAETTRVTAMLGIKTLDGPQSLHDQIVAVRKAGHNPASVTPELLGGFRTFLDACTATRL